MDWVVTDLLAASVAPTPGSLSRLITGTPLTVDRRQPTRRLVLAGVVAGPVLADHSDLDLARILEIVFQAAGDVSRQLC